MKMTSAEQNPDLNIFSAAFVAQNLRSRMVQFNGYRRRERAHEKNHLLIIKVVKHGLSTEMIRFSNSLGFCFHRDDRLTWEREIYFR